MLFSRLQWLLELCFPFMFILNYPVTKTCSLGKLDTMSFSWITIYMRYVKKVVACHLGIDYVWEFGGKGGERE